MAEITIDQKIFIIPDSGSACDAWKVYFEKLKDQVGKENARIVWLMTWSKNGSTSCTTNEDFNKFLKKNEIDVSSAATRAIADMSAIGGNILGLGKTLSKVIAIAAPVLFSSIIIIVIMLLVKTARKADVVDLALLASGGAGRAVLAAKNIGK